MSNLTSQALIRAGRTLIAGLIAAAITLLPQVVGVFELDPTYSGAIILGLTAFLNGLGKLMREETIPVTDASAAKAAVAATPGVENAKAAPIPF
jgi:hypothetical protein